MDTLDQRIRDRLNDCNWYGLRSALLAILDELPTHAGPPINRMVCADTVRGAVAKTLGISLSDYDVTARPRSDG